MDNSETYIKMRRQAIPDLGIGIPIECPCNHIANDVWVDSKGDWYFSTEYETFQLERQDQLQEEFFSCSVEHHPEVLLECFYEFVMENPLGQIPRDHVASYEQLWLAFGMKEKYNKVWDGEAWIDSC